MRICRGVGLSHAKTEPQRRIRRRWWQSWNGELSRSLPFLSILNHFCCSKGFNASLNGKRVNSHFFCATPISYRVFFARSLELEWPSPLDWVSWFSHGWHWRLWVQGQLGASAHSSWAGWYFIFICHLRVPKVDFRFGVLIRDTILQFCILKGTWPTRSKVRSK